MSATAEISSGDRFAFGENWARFLQLVDDDRINQAEQSLAHMLGCEDLQGRTFVDVGCGSGLFSLAARNLGARVVSLDFDLASVRCTTELRRRYRANDSDSGWTVLEGSALDRDFMTQLGQFDVVYSWGVLHHTGQMITALDNVSGLAAPGGQLFVAIYNDQGRRSRIWWHIKRLYNGSNRLTRGVLLAVCAVRLETGPLLRRKLNGVKAGHSRGMDPWRDVVDWVGGWPYEVARPEAIFEFYHDRGFDLERILTVPGHGCNQFVFAKRSIPIGE